jgi:threonine aldolase
MAPRARSTRPIAVSITELSELGAAYRPEEVAAIADVARERRMAMHVDGARFAGAVAALGCAPADLTWRAGVDVLSFGGTKNGCLAAEAVVFFDVGQAEGFALARQRAGHTFSKGWFVAAQFSAYLADGHWLDLARHANAMAAKLAVILKTVPGVKLALEPAANEIFAVVPRALAARLKAGGVFFHEWSVEALAPADRPCQREAFIRLVATFSTSPAEIDRLAALLDSAGAEGSV